MNNPLHPTNMQNYNTGTISSCFAIPILFVCLALSGCMGVYEGGFECPAGEGVGCKSISDVNEMINQEVLPLSKTRMEEIEDGEHKDDVPCGKENSCPLRPKPWYWAAPGALMEEEA